MVKSKVSRQNSCPRVEPLQSPIPRLPAHRRIRPRRVAHLPACCSPSCGMYSLATASTLDSSASSTRSPGFLPIVAYAHVVLLTSGESHPLATRFHLRVELHKKVVLACAMELHFVVQGLPSSPARTSRVETEPAAPTHVALLFAWPTGACGALSAHGHG